MQSRSIGHKHHVDPIIVRFVGVRGEAPAAVHIDAVAAAAHAGRGR